MKVKRKRSEEKQKWTESDAYFEWAEAGCGLILAVFGACACFPILGWLGFIYPVIELNQGTVAAACLIFFLIAAGIAILLFVIYELFLPDRITKTSS